MHSKVLLGDINDYTQFSLSFFPVTRVEHASFTDKESEAFLQLCRVVLLDFLPFVKRCFESLFSESTVEPVALSTPYGLRHCQKQKAGVLPGSRPGVDIKMELDVKAIGEMLRGVAPEVFDELERQSSLATLNLDMENLLNSSNDQPMLVGSSDPRASISEDENKTSEHSQDCAGTDSELSNAKSTVEEETKVEFSENKADSLSTTIEDRSLLKSNEMLIADGESTSQDTENENGEQMESNSQLHTAKLPVEEGVTGARTAKTEQLKGHSTDHHWTNTFNYQQL